MKENGDKIKQAARAGERTTKYCTVLYCTRVDKTRSEMVYYLRYEKCEKWRERETAWV